MRPFQAAAMTAVALALTPMVSWAQNPQPGASDSLRLMVGRITARLDSLEAGRCPAGPPIALPGRPAGAASALDTLITAVERLNQRLERAVADRCAAQAAQAAPPQGQAPAAADTTDDLAALRAAASDVAGGVGQGEAGGRPRAQGAPSSDTSRVPPAAAPPATGGPRGANVLNPEISATGDIRLIARDQNPQHDNALAREFEVSFQSALDPFSKTKIFLTFEQDQVGVEEGYIYWAGLPGHIRLDLGKFRQQLGDLNRWHLHALPETEYPLVYQRFLGTEGLTGIGFSLYTALPFSLAGGTHEIVVQGTTAESTPLYADGHQPTLLGRLQNFWQLSRSTYAQVGFTATGGNNSDADLRSRLLGLDFRLTYRPPSAGTRRDITFRAEGYRLHAADSGAVTNRYGAFLDLQARTSQRWVWGVRYDWVQSPRGLADTQWRITPALTWWESEFVFLRLQGEHQHSDLTGSQNLLTLQAVWAMGPHKHETY